VRAGAASLVVGVTLLAAGCGGGGGGGGALPAAAKVVPAGAPVLISFKTDFNSRQWRNALALLHKFPGAPQLLHRASVEAGNIDFQHDVKPALGPEVDVVFLDFKNGGNDVVGLTQPKSKAKLKALIAKENSSGTGTGTDVTAEVNGWMVVADSQSKIDAFRRASSGDKLDGVGEFKDAMGRLDDQAGVRAYVAGDAVQRELDRALDRSGAPPNLTRDLARMESISAAGLIERNGVRADSALATDPAPSPKTVAPTLAGSLPAGALLYVDTADLAAPTRTILKLVGRSQPKFETQLHQVETVLGLSLEKDVYPLLSREEAFALYAAKPLPKMVFLAKAPDENRARELLAHVVELFKIGAGLSVSTFDVGGVSVDDVSQPGSRVHVFIAVGRGKLIVTNARDTLATLVEGKGPKLADDPLYKRARADAKMPSKVVGMAYADLTRGLPFAFDLAEANGSVVPPEARPNTKALSHALLYALQDGKRFRLSGFLAIK
jgi:Protein of unknown function (DUF3352)